MKSLFTLDTLDIGEVRDLIRQGSRLRSDAQKGREIWQTLKGVTVANLFFEPSTRTQLSFDLASQKLGASVLNFNEAGSSAVKGESLRDTVETVAAIGSDILVVRHGDAEIPELVAEWTGKSVVNAGNGALAHPTQALLDCVTLRRHFGEIDGLTVGIVGDVVHSRVASSLARLLPRLGAEVTFVGPQHLLPTNSVHETASSIDALVSHLDVVYMLRVQTERGAEVSEDFQTRFQMNASRMDAMKENGVVMHAGPVNRGVEIASEILSNPKCLVLEQVANGTPARMAVLEWVWGVAE